MVKNTKGGSKHKKMARKTTDQNISQERVRYSTCDDEIYGSVAKLYGNGRMLVTCNDGLERQCIIRKKFRGKNKRGNEVALGSYILVGRREWEKNKVGLEVTDLLYVYSHEQSSVLKKDPNVNTKVLNKNENKFRNSNEQEDENEYMDFMNDIEEESDIEFHSEEEESDQQDQVSSFTNYQNDEVQVDDI